MSEGVCVCVCVCECVSVYVRACVCVCAGRDGAHRVVEYRQQGREGGFAEAEEEREHPEHSES